MADDRGVLVISLDFELYWGMRDRVPLDRYRENLLGVRQAIPRMLELFDEFGVHATWATVGFLFSRSRDEMLASVPKRLPRYDDTRLSPYPHLSAIGSDESSDPFHFGRTLIERIRRSPHQEIGTHTFSHYYCLESGQTEADFRADLAAAIHVARAAGIELRSIVFPRNQVAPWYLAACAEAGIVAFRGSERSWPYMPRPLAGETPVRRAVRLVDSYLDLTSHHATAPTVLPESGIVNIPASRFLRPYTRSIRHLERLRRRRITSAMSHAAAHGLVYHLWWHPHNFGRNLEQNLAVLRRILEHFRRLTQSHGMRSLGMAELAGEVLQSRAWTHRTVAGGETSASRAWW
jgi:peptidoglycan/xylan/chitin deacetylase (PgdA/CDA1 family)